MKCPNCQSHMFVVDETTNDRSHVTFTRCSVCASEHVSSEPILNTGSSDGDGYFGSTSNDSQRFFMA